MGEMALNAEPANTEGTTLFSFTGKIDFPFGDQTMPEIAILTVFLFVALKNGATAI
jgi:hypothetical protein